MNTLLSTTVAADKWIAFEEELSGLETETIIIVDGKAFIVSPASPGDVERIMKGIKRD